MASTGSVHDPIVVLERRLAALTSTATRPIVVALDGRSGTGKSTLAAAVAARLPNCTVIEGDAFYAGGSGELWDALSPAQKAEHALDWRRQRPVLEALRGGRAARWRAFDWDAFDGTFEPEARRCDPADVVLLEGAFSARPELADLLDLRALLLVDEDVRRERLRIREGDDLGGPWDARWSEAEGYYFSRVMPPEAFDLVLRAQAG